MITTIKGEEIISEEVVLGFMKDDFYTKKLKGKQNPSERTKKQHFNILNLNKKGKKYV